MAAAMTTVGGDASVDAVCSALERDGGVIVEGFAPPALVDSLLADLEPFLGRSDWGRDDFSGGRTRRASALFARTRHAADVVQHPLFLGPARRILQRPTASWLGAARQESVPTVQVGGTQVIRIFPGEQEQPLHRDDMVFQWRHPTHGREARVQLMLALGEFTADNGATLVVPGSNHWDDERAPRRDEAVPAVMPAGAALIFLGSTYHGGGGNRSAAPRTGLTMTLDLGYLRQEENQYLSVPPSIVAGYPDEVRRLLGYAACPPLMGWIEVDGQMVDPLALLDAPAG